MAPPSKPPRQEGGGGLWIWKASLLAPVIFFALNWISQNVWSSFLPSPDRPPLLCLPFFGAALGPLAVALCHDVLWQLGLPRPVKVVLIFIVMAPLAFHNLLNVVYANINNDSWSNSIMIDVVADESFFHEFVNVPRDLFKQSTNPKTWVDSITAPHLDLEGVRNAECGKRTFMRFMCHNMNDKRARISKILDGDQVMFCGIWAMHEGAKDSVAHPPKVFTDNAYGNDLMFNKHLVRNLMVDPLNFYAPFNKTLTDKGWTVRTLGPVANYPEGFNYDIEFGEKLESKNYVMDQYSSMFETRLQHRVMDQQWCFYKFMEGEENFASSGTLNHPILANGALKFPQGSPEDCSIPYVRAVYAKGLHWRRDNYLC